MNTVAKGRAYIQTKEDLSVAFKDNMYFGINKTEGKRASNQNMMVAQGVTGYRHKSAGDVQRNALFASSHARSSALGSAFAGATLGTTIDKVKEAASDLIDTAVSRVQHYYYNAVEFVSDNVTSLQNSFNNVVNSTATSISNGLANAADAIEDGYDVVSAKFNSAVDSGSALIDSGYAYVSSGFNSGVSRVSNFFSELKEDSLEAIGNMSIAGSLAARTTSLQPALALAGPAPRI